MVAFKLMVADITEWCDAITQGIEGVTPNLPPQSLVDKLEDMAANRAARRQPMPSTGSALIIINNNYDHNPACI
jgi:hypothetical protein